MRTKFCIGVVFGLFIQTQAITGSVSKTTKDKSQITYPAGTPAQTVSSINNITSWVRHDGFFDWAVEGSWNGTYPKGTIGVVFSEGVVWGGFVRDGSTPDLRVGGSTYSTGLVPGAILTDSLGNVIGREDPNAPDVRIYRVRPDWQTADLRDDAAQYFMKSPDSVTQQDIQQIRNQYTLDWNQWPTRKGAPYKDVNNNGQYDPSTDTAGIPGADQTIWFVANDLGPNATVYGSPSIGLEMQMTIWAFNKPGALNNIIFKRTRLIYKGTMTTPSNARIDTLYIAQWSDPDLGYYPDDFVGCDTILNMGYVYNSSPVDALYRDRFGLPPPAAGYDFFQGPIVPGAPNDTAIFDFQYRRGFRNLPMTTFTYFATGGQRSDPDRYLYSGTLQWYNLMRGCEPRPAYPSCVPFLNHLGQVTRFELSGDPVAGTGDLDGRVNPPGDRRIALVSGPITMARRDTQEIVIALIGSLGTNYLNSITRLKANNRVAQTAYNNFFKALPPKVYVSTQFGMSSTTVHILADARRLNATGMTASLRRYNDSLVAALPLFDDGAHGDSAAGDHIYGNTFSVTPQRDGLFLNLNVSYSTVPLIVWERVAENISTAGPVYVSSFRIASDNMNNDSIANPGENIRYVITLRNGSSSNLSSLVLTPSPDSEYKRIPAGNLNAGSTFSLNYNPADPLSYFSFNVPSNYPDSIFSVILSVTDTSYNYWEDTLNFLIMPFPQPVYGTPINHTRGRSDWNFNVLVVNPSAVQNHTYEITIVDSIDTARSKGFTLRDSTANITLLLNHPFPDQLGHNIPVTAGFKVLRGSLFGRLGGFRLDSTRWISPYPVWFRGFRFASDPVAAFDGGVTTGFQLGEHYLSHVRSSFDPRNSFPVEVRFSVTQTQGAYRLRRTGPTTGYMIQSISPFVSVPFTVWDVSDPSSPRQLTVAWRDQNNDGTWDPPIESDGLEIIFIYNKTYVPSGTGQFSMPPNAIENECTIGPNADIVYGLSLAVLTEHILNENPGALYIRPWIALSSQDRFTFNPTVISSVSEPMVPKAFSLLQNYPNPFNTTTVIQYSLPVAAKVTLKIFNILGQEIVTLVDEVQDRGYKTVTWNSTNKAGKSVSTGVYLYRLEATTSGGQKFRETKKMLLLK